jgi:hypothetical protein
MIGNLVKRRWQMAFTYEECQFIKDLVKILDLPRKPSKGVCSAFDLKTEKLPIQNGQIYSRPTSTQVKLTDNIRAFVPPVLG